MYITEALIRDVTSKINMNIEVFSKTLSISVFNKDPSLRLPNKVLAFLALSHMFLTPSWRLDDDNLLCGGC